VIFHKGKKKNLWLPVNHERVRLPSPHVLRRVRKGAHMGRYVRAGLHVVTATPSLSAERRVCARCRSGWPSLCHVSNEADHIAEVAAARDFFGRWCPSFGG